MLQSLVVHAAAEALVVEATVPPQLHGGTGACVSAPEGDTAWVASSSGAVHQLGVLRSVCWVRWLLGFVVCMFVCFFGSVRRVWVFVNTTEHVLLFFSGSVRRVWAFVNKTEHGLF